MLVKMIKKKKCKTVSTINLTVKINGWRNREIVVEQKQKIRSNYLFEFDFGF